MCFSFVRRNKHTFDVFKRHILLMKRTCIAGQKSTNEIKKWFELHSVEYEKFAERLKAQGIGSVMEMGEKAFWLSPAFKEQVDKAVKSGNLDISSLLESLAQSDFAANYFRERNEENMAMAAWIKYGDMPEMVVGELGKNIVGQSKRKYRDMLFKIHGLFLDRFFQRRHDDGKAFVPENTDITGSDGFLSLLTSHDGEMVERIREWTAYRSGGMNIACLYIALLEAGEISTRLPLTRFWETLRSAFPQHEIVGVRQLQKSVNYLQSLSPNRKQYIKDEPEHRFAIDTIKTEVLLKSTDTVT